MADKKVIKRLVFGTLLILFLLGYLLAEGWLSSHNYFLRFHQATGLGFAALAGLILLGACWELLYLGRQRELNVPLWVLGPAVVLLAFEPIISNWFGNSYYETVPFLLVLLFSLIALVHGLTRGAQQAMAHLGFAALGLLYLGLGGWFLVKIRLLCHDGGGVSEQIATSLWFIFTVKSTDIGAYFTGRFLGKHPWVPSISPKKTWEGLAGGMVLAMIVSSIFAGIFAIIPIALAAVFGLVLAVIGQMGDLMESMFKRDAAIKDSAALIPEFGGLLDLLDSILITAPFAYMLLLVFGKVY